MRAVLLCAFMAAASVAERPCDLRFSVDITTGLKYANGSVEFEGLMYERSERFTHERRTMGCPCEKRVCVRRCCKPGLSLVASQCTATNQTEEPFQPMMFNQNLSVDLPPDYFVYLYANLCQHGRYELEAGEADFLENGSLIMKNDFEMTMYDHTLFCMEQNASGNIQVQMCFPASEDAPNFLLYIIGMAISLPFLLVTLLVYMFVPELQNLHGKTLMGYVSGLLFAYIFLIIAQAQATMEQSYNRNFCTFLAYAIYFCFMVSFFWLNVMCFDIWWSFRGMRTSISRRTAERRRFRNYCIYAWGGPIIMSLICTLADYHPNFPAHLRPNFGVDKCWFAEQDLIAYYFYGPISILIFVNILFFVMTAYKILSIKRETAMFSGTDSGRHSQLEKDKQRFILYLKLFSVMGINWIAELLSYYVKGSQYYWIVTDVCNSLQGIFIFIIFVCKKKVKDLVIKRHHSLRYGSSASRSRSSSRFRTGNISMSTGASDLQTEKSFISAESRPMCVMKQ